MQSDDILRSLSAKGVTPLEVAYPNGIELEIRVERKDFKAACFFMHTQLHSPVMALFAVDCRTATGNFEVRCVFLAKENSRWCSIVIVVPADDPRFDSLAKEIYSAALFEREIKEMFGITPDGNPDVRSLCLHEEVWPQGVFPLRKDFTQAPASALAPCEYRFTRVEGEGVFEVPVGPVHAGIIGPGHFRFSVAGEPIINLELRLGFTHRGVEKLFEGKTLQEGLKLSECIAGDSVISHSWAFCRAVETIMGVTIEPDAFRVRAISLEMERIYNHLTGIAGIALDVGFSFPAQFAQLLKERMMLLNKELCGHRYLKGILVVGGGEDVFEQNRLKYMLEQLSYIKRDMQELRAMLYGSVSFMDRVDETGILRKKTVQDFGVIGLAARASGIALDLRRQFPEGYTAAGFRLIKQEKGDVLSRLNVRIDEIDESLRLIECFAKNITKAHNSKNSFRDIVQGHALGAVEGSRGPAIYWVKVIEGKIDRCKIVDASFHNWQGLSIAVLGNIVPDFPVCNKSFDLSYAGNDL
ncbi:MAG: NADH-quinone oxidoreductase subunit C [Candidatus Omnitrophota bacterium]|jgi:Ni,Fe-hydrogenase III large subunit/Ni,Fe-hydrogenase III component G